MRMSANEAVNDVVRRLDDLPSADQPFQALQNLKTAVFAIHPSALQQVVPNISFNIIFEFLDTDDPDQIEVCCSLVSRLLGALPPSSIVSNFSTELTQGMNHPNAHVYSLTLDSLHRCCVDSNAAMTLARRPDLLKLMIKGLGSEEGEISKRVRRSFVAFGQHLHGRESLLAGEASADLNRLRLSSSTNRYRVLETVVGIAAHSAASLDFCVASGFLDHLVDDLDDDDDVLVQLNCISLLADLSAFPHGFLYLEKIGTVERMETVLRQSNDNGMEALLLPGLLKFFGNLMYIYPDQITRKWPRLVARVISSVSEGDPLLSVAAVDTMGLVGASARGKEALHAVGGPSLRAAMQQLGVTMFSSATDSDVRIRAIEAAAHLLKLPVGDQDENLLNLTQSWFSFFSPQSTMSEVSRLCRLPFLSVRCASLRLVQSLTDQTWGQREMCQLPGFQEYLLNRETETELEGWNAKFGVVAALAESSSTRGVFGDPYFVRLKAYVAEGPVYKRTEAEVATVES